MKPFVFVIGALLPALTDKGIEVHTVTDDMGIWGAFNLLLVEETSLPGDFLSAIGQPLTR